MNSPVFLILSGANERAVVAVCRTLSRQGRPFAILARGRDDPLWKTAYRHRILAQRTSDAIDSEDILHGIETVRRKLGRQKLLYLPTSESLNRLALQNRSRFSDACDRDLPMVDEAVYLAISEKSSFLRLAAEAGLATPARVARPTAGCLPIAAKPAKEFHPGSLVKLYPELLFTQIDLDRFLLRPDAPYYFLQEFIAGQSYYGLFWFSGNGDATVLWQINLAQQPNGKSILAARLCPCPSKETEEALIALLKGLKYYGFIMIEVIRRIGIDYVIEANPRIWGPFQLAIDGGFNPSFFAGDECRNVGNIDARYAWIGGMIHAGSDIRWYPHQKEAFLHDFRRYVCSDALLRRDSYRIALSKF